MYNWIRQPNRLGSHEVPSFLAVTVFKLLRIFLARDRDISLLEMLGRGELSPQIQK
jgi:hypothetical protein